jgi:hypothetical protein
MADLVKTFSADGDFVAMMEAEAFLRDAGFSIGTNQRGDPRGIMFGDYVIMKWRNLRKFERDALDGVSTGNNRTGPVTVRIFAHASQEAKRAFHNVAVARAAMTESGKTEQTNSRDT